MKIYFLILLTLLSLTAPAQQLQAIYEFNNNLNETSGKFPALKELGNAKGRFMEEILPELDNLKRPVYVFNKNCGLKFDNSAANNFFKGSYTIEMYFRFDYLNSWKRVIDWKNRKSDTGAYIFDGKLNFYKIVVSDLAPVREGEYTHYVITRDAATKVVKIFADGVGKIEFIDSGDLAVLDRDNEMHFFYDDLQVGDEASNGAVAYIKLYNYLLEPQQVKTVFSELKNNIQKPEPAEVHTGIQLSGLVKDSKTKKPVQANVSVIQSTEKKTTAGPDGSFSVKGDAGISYHIKITAPGYIPFDHIYSGVTTNTSVNIELQPIEVGTTVTLKNIQFEQGKSELLESSHEELDKLVTLLKENPNMEIQVNGHTDNQGDPNKNLKLSEDRVKTVKQYLISKGIAEKRITGKGFGGSKPIADNRNPETRKLNRRVEFTIIKN